jgi:hypothetical protein
MIDDPMIYLVVERIKQLSNSGMDFEEIDCQLNILHYILFDTNKSTGENNGYAGVYRLLNSYLHLEPEDYQSMGIEANIWFFELIYDHIARRNSDLADYKNISRLLTEHKNINHLASLYVILEHPYCRYLVMMIYSNLLHENRNLMPLDNFIDKILDKHFESHDEFFNKEDESLERDLIKKDIEAILEDIGTMRRREDY